MNIQQYVSNAQLYFDSVVKEKCYKILDYLYSITPNDKENAVNYLQIQKMDLRGAKEVQISNSIVRLEPNITGAAEEVIQKKKLKEEPINEIENIIKKCNKSVSNGEVDLDLIFLAMDKLLEIMDDSGLHIQYDDAFIKLIVLALSSEKLQSEDRSELCSMWIAGLNQLILNGNFLPEYFDAYVDKKRRRNCENKIKYIEQKVLSIDSEYVRLQLYQSLMLSVTRYCYGDWSKCQTSYSDRDMRFLNEQFTKYGKYHIEKMLETIYQLRIEELLPDILISIKNSFQEAKVDGKKFARAIQEQKSIVNMIILKAYVQYNGEIKQNNKLIVAFEDILETLIDQNFEEAAIILDEFRIH